MANSHFSECKWYAVASLLLISPLLTARHQLISPFLPLLPLDNKLTESSLKIDSFPELQHLELRGNRLQCPPLKFDAPKLTRLYLAANNITSLKGLDSLTMLQVLNLRGNKIENLDGLDVLTSLVYLNLRYLFGRPDFQAYITLEFILSLQVSIY